MKNNLKTKLKTKAMYIKRKKIDQKVVDFIIKNMDTFHGRWITGFIEDNPIVGQIVENGDIPYILNSIGNSVSLTTSIRNVVITKKKPTTLIVADRLSDKVCNNPAYVSVKGSKARAFLDKARVLSKRVKETDPNCFDLRKGEISYFMGVQDYTNGKWERKGRQVMKASKFLRSIKDCIVLSECDTRDKKTRDALINRAIEMFGERLKSTPINIKVSDKVKDTYSIPIAMYNTGTLGGSCMNPSQRERYAGSYYLSFYDDIGTKIAYATDNEGRLIGRALLWEGVINEDNGEEFKFMDRIYGSEQTIEAFKEWAEDNGYLYKKEQSYCNSTLIDPETGESIRRFYYEIPISVNEIEGAPYIDTFICMDTCDSTLVSYDDDHDYDCRWIELIDMQRTQGNDWLQQNYENYNN